MARPPKSCCRNMSNTLPPSCACDSNRLRPQADRNELRIIRLFFGNISVSRLLLLTRSLAFNALFYANLLLHMVVALPTLLLPYPVARAFIRSYARSSLWLLRVICGTD